MFEHKSRVVLVTSVHFHVVQPQPFRRYPQSLDLD